MHREGASQVELVTSARVTSLAAIEGSPMELACAAGKRAAAGATSGADIESLLDEARRAFGPPPNWSLEQWLENQSRPR